MATFLVELLSRMGYVFLEHRQNGEFRLLAPAPAWLRELWGIYDADGSTIPLASKSPFLEQFLHEADALLALDSAATCQSEIWIEQSASGKEIPLQALAIQAEGNRYLALHSPEVQFQERRHLLQTARDSHLEHEKLLREIQKKEILLHCIIHDLSQPLSVMSVTLDCLADEPVSERAKHLLGLGKLASDQQLSMIRDILQVFSADLKAAQDAEKGAGFTADLLQSAKQAIGAYAPVFQAKGVRLELCDPGELRANWLVHGESARLQRVFSNLLENALRYTPPGSRVTIGLEREGDVLKAFVDDEGPGLPPDLPPSQVFALFSKGKESGGKAGLGLYFCRLTVERWGGSIGCEPRPGRGTRFWFRLPSAGIQSGRTVGEQAPEGRTTNRVTATMPKGPMRILLADDQKEIRLLTSDQLQRGGHHVVAVADGAKVLEALQREKFDVILMDEQMPRMTGIEALRAIREKEPEYGRSVVIALTGYNTDPDRERLMSAGFDGVIGKPFRMASLEELLLQPNESVASDATARPQESGKERTEADLLQRIGGDVKLLRKMIQTFRRDTPKRMAEIQKAIRQKNTETLASVAHALKGSVSIFGGEKACLHCLQLQELGRNGQISGAAGIYRLLKEEIAELEANLRGYAGQKGSPRRGGASKRGRRTPSSRRKPG